MPKENPGLHIICGRCGCRTMLSYRIEPTGQDIDGILYPSVDILCGNCGTLTSLDEILEERARKSWLGK